MLTWIALVASTVSIGGLIGLGLRMQRLETQSRTLLDWALQHGDPGPHTRFALDGHGRLIIRGGAHNEH